jgi:hypothetical protein
MKLRNAEEKTMQLETEVLETSPSRSTIDRADERGAALPLMGPADPGTATPLMGPADPGTVTPLMLPGR